MPTVRQVLHAQARLRNPAAPAAKLAAKFYSPTVARAGRKLEQATGFKVAMHQLRDAYRDRAMQLLPAEKIAEEIVGLARGAESESVRLSALGQLLEDYGIREPADQQRLVVQVQQVFIAQVAPVIFSAIPSELHPQVRTAIRQALADARRSHDVWSGDAFDGRDDRPQLAGGVNALAVPPDASEGQSGIFAEENSGLEGGDFGDLTNQGQKDV